MGFKLKCLIILLKLCIDIDADIDTDTIYSKIKYVQFELLL